MRNGFKCEILSGSEDMAFFGAKKGLYTWAKLFFLSTLLHFFAFSVDMG